MRPSACALTTSALLLVLLAMPLRAAEPTEEAAVPRLSVTYLGLSMGPLQQALLVELPAGVVLRAGDLQLTAAEVRTEIEAARDDSLVYPQLQKNAFFVLEKKATRALLLREARAWAQKESVDISSESPGSLLETYLQGLAAGRVAEVTEEEARAFFAANASMFAGASYEQVAAELRQWLRAEKIDVAIQAHINGLSLRTPVELSANWVAAQAPVALDTPLDKARRSGLPTLVDFGAQGCAACDKMQPILAQLEQKWGTRCRVLFVSVRQEPVLAARYGIQAIPVQIFFDSRGLEVFRNVGYLPQQQIEDHLAEVGVK